MSDFRLFEHCRNENFSTALLAFSMRASPQFAVLVSRFLLQKALCLQPQTLSVEEIDRDYPIRLKHWESSKRVDLLIVACADDKRFLILIEAKITAMFGPNQLQDYRAWLNSQQADVKVLTTLTRYSYDGDVLTDASVRWTDFQPYISRMQADAASDFERLYWKNLGLHMEDTMRVFTGFTSGHCDVLTLLQEVDLFLAEILERLHVTKTVDYWQKERAAYYVPELKTTIGFYWWQKDFWREPEPNRFCVWVDGQKDRQALASLDEIVKNTNSSVPEDSRDAYISKLVDQIRSVCGEAVGAD